MHHVEPRVLLENLHFQPIERAAAGVAKVTLPWFAFTWAISSLTVLPEVQPRDQDAWGVGANRNRARSWSGLMRMLEA